STGTSSPATWTGRERDAPTRTNGKAPRQRRQSLLEAISRPEDPDDGGERHQDRRRHHCDAGPQGHVAHPEEGPAVTRDEIEDRIEKSDRAPRFADRSDRVEDAA